MIDEDVEMMPPTQASSDKLHGLSKRLEKCEKLKQLLQERRQKIAEIICNEMGKPVKECAGEVDKSIKLIEYY